jgi:uncharacterized protein DUF5317
MFILYALLAGIVVGLATGGRLSALASVRFHWVPLIAVGFLTQVVLFSGAVAERVGDLGPAIYVASTAMVGAAVIRNLRLPGMPLIVLGAASNLAAILANGGYMPAAPEALASLGKVSPMIYSNSSVVASPYLPWLIDRFALPRWLPLANVFSLGDALLAVGVFILVVVTMRTPPESLAEPASGRGPDPAPTPGSDGAPTAA